MSDKILIIGSIPPPIGGVTLHTQRLLAALDKNKISYSFLPIKDSSLFKIIKQLLSHKIIHLQISNIYVSFFLVIFSRLMQKKIIVTRHEEMKRYQHRTKTINNLTIKFATAPILLNKQSYEIGITLNKRAIQMSAFIPPQSTTPLPDHLINKIISLRKKYRFIFCTNAYNLSFDSHNRETYGIIPLIDVFRNIPTMFLFAATCNPNYINYIKKMNISIPNNVFLIDEPIDYPSIIKATDGSIRNTTTDGDALSIREALFFSKCVFATDCVSRPDGTVVYHDTNELTHLLQNFVPHTTCYVSENTVDRIIQVYQTI